MSANRLIGLLFPLAAFAAPACAILDPVWTVVAPSMEPVWMQVSAEQMRAICPEDFACIRRRFETRTCLVFSPSTREDVPDFIIEHEEIKHCIEGKNHD